MHNMEMLKLYAQALVSAVPSIPHSIELNKPDNLLSLDVPKPYPPDSSQPAHSIQTKVFHASFVATSCSRPGWWPVDSRLVSPAGVPPAAQGVLCIRLAGRKPQA